MNLIKIIKNRFIIIVFLNFFLFIFFILHIYINQGLYSTKIKISFDEKIENITRNLYKENFLSKYLNFRTEYQNELLHNQFILRELFLNRYKLLDEFILFYNNNEPKYEITKIQNDQTNFYLFPNPRYISVYTKFKPKNINDFYESFELRLNQFLYSPFNKKTPNRDESNNLFNIELLDQNELKKLDNQFKSIQAKNKIIIKNYYEFITEKKERIKKIEIILNYLDNLTINNKNYDGYFIHQDYFDNYYFINDHIDHKNWYEILNYLNTYLNNPLNFKNLDFFINNFFSMIEDEIKTETYETLIYLSSLKNYLIKEKFNYLQNLEDKKINIDNLIYTIQPDDFKLFDNKKYIFMEKIKNNYSIFHLLNLFKLFQILLILNFGILFYFKFFDKSPIFQRKKSNKVEV